MPPKHVSAARMPTLVKEGEKVKIEDVSVGDDSGWRPVDEVRVEELTQLFLTGQYGIGLLKPPSVIARDGQPVLAIDGRQCLSDGKSTMSALARLKKIYEDPDQRDSHEWSTSLVEALTDGVRVNVLQYPEADYDLAIAHNALARDVDSNKYKASSLRGMADVGERFRRKVPGGEWAATQGALIQVYGKAKKTFCWRMVVIAQTISGGGPRKGCLSQDPEFPRAG